MAICFWKAWFVNDVTLYSPPHYCYHTPIQNEWLPFRVALHDIPIFPHSPCSLTAGTSPIVRNFLCFIFGLKIYFSRVTNTLTAMTGILSTKFTYFWRFQRRNYSQKWHKIFHTVLIRTNFKLNIELNISLSSCWPTDNPANRSSTFIRTEQNNFLLPKQIAILELIEDNFNRFHC